MIDLVILCNNDYILVFYLTIYILTLKKLEKVFSLSDNHLANVCSSAKQKYTAQILTYFLLVI